MPAANPNMFKTPAPVIAAPVPVVAPVAAPAQRTITGIPIEVANRNAPANAAYNAQQQQISAQLADQQAIANDPYRGRKVIDDDQFKQMLDLGYDELTLREQYLPKSQKDTAKKLGDMFWNAPAYQKPTTDTTKSVTDQSARSLIMQQVLGPYLRQLNGDFNNARTGMQATNDQLMQQIAPQYQPYLKAMNNAATQSQDQSWIDSLNAMAVQPSLDEQNKVLADYVNALKTQSGGGADASFLQGLGITTG